MRPVARTKHTFLSSQSFPNDVVCDVLDYTVADRVKNSRNEVSRDFSDPSASIAALSIETFSKHLISDYRGLPQPR